MLNFMIIGITGPIASGKSVLVEMLIEKGFVYFGLSGELREEAKKEGIPMERKALQDYGNSTRERFGNDYWAKRIIAKMSPEKNYIIDGIRNPGEIEALRKLGNFVLIGISAPIEKRLTWIKNRNHDSDPKTIEEIMSMEARDRGVGEAEHGQQSWKCYEIADVFIENNGTFEELEKKVSDLLEDLKC
jgi:dephospho-CoA kinase